MPALIEDLRYQLERDPELVSKDYLDELLSMRSVTEVHHFVLDEKTGVVDYAATEHTRHAEREARKRRGKPYHFRCARRDRVGADRSAPELCRPAGSGVAADPCRRDRYGSASGASAASSRS